MSHCTALPFVLRRKRDVIRHSPRTEITSTREAIHGLLRLDGDRLIIQWSIARQTQLVGAIIRVDRELEPVREIGIPLPGLAGARVRWQILAVPPRLELVLTAADLRAFEALAGDVGLLLDHPALIALEIRFRDRDAARDFASELELQVADVAMRIAESSTAVGPPATPQLPTETRR